MVGTAVVVLVAVVAGTTTWSRPWSAVVVVCVAGLGVTEATAAGLGGRRNGGMARGQWRPRCTEESAGGRAAEQATWPGGHGGRSGHAAAEVRSGSKRPQKGARRAQRGRPGGPGRAGVRQEPLPKTEEEAPGDARARAKAGSATEGAQLRPSGPGFPGRFGAGRLPRLGVAAPKR